MTRSLSPAKRLPVTLLRWMVGDLNFTTVSNNSWGGQIYQALDIPSRSPFAGMFIPPKSYLHLLKRFDTCITAELEFANESASPRINVWREREALNYPIGLLEQNIELHFLHAADEKDARTKWQEGCGRIVADPSRRFFKFDDSWGATPEEVEEFCALPFANKVCFTTARYNSSTVIVPAVAIDSGAHNADGTLLADISRQYFNALRWISSWPPAASLPSAF
jgi:uncharacterized protein (DUF1919 family)